jgi:hypothetical protein
MTALLTLSRVAKSPEYISIDKVLALQVNQMRPFFVVGHMRTNSIRHHHNEAAIIHVQPIAPTN